MPFTGKATYTAGSTLPEIAEDVSDLVAISSPHETPLLDALGDPARPARSTIREWRVSARRAIHSATPDRCVCRSSPHRAPPPRAAHPSGPPIPRARPVVRGLAPVGAPPRLRGVREGAPPAADSLHPLELHYHQ